MSESIKYIQINNESELDNIRHESVEASSDKDFTHFGTGHRYYKINFKIKNSYFNKLKKYDTKKIVFYKCKFKFRLVLYTVPKIEVVNNVVVSPLRENIKPKNTLDFILEDLEFEFYNCEFEKSLSLNHHTYSEKISFKSCYFDSINITNSTFKKLFEVYNCSVDNPSVFNKVDFLDNAVFTKSRFKSNVLFTYTIFEKLGIFSRVKFEKCGLDLSQSIINGNLTFFETKLENYDSEKIDSTSQKYDDAITETGIIPIQNKRETFRIIKQQLVQQNNLIVAEKYAKLEKQTYLEEKYLEAVFENNDLKKIRLIFSDYLILKLNKYSNYFKTSWLVGLSFTLGVTFIFHSILSISEGYNFSDIKKYISLLNLTDFDLLNKGRSDIFYIIVFIAKLSIGFGIYQLVQAFRKFK